MRDILEAIANGSLSPAEVEMRLFGYATTDTGRFDVARETRRGVPEATLAEGKTPDETTTLAVTTVETSGRALIIRADAAYVEAATDALPDADIDHDARVKTVVAIAPEFERPDLDATVVIAIDGTPDAEAAGETAAVLHEMGVDVERVEDMGVAHLGHVLDNLDTLREADVVVVAAGREGVLPTTVAGLADTSVIGLLVSTGHGHGGDSKAAVLGILQSYTVPSAANVGAGYITGAQAEPIARAVADARDDDA